MKHIHLEPDGDILRVVIDRAGDDLNRTVTEVVPDDEVEVAALAFAQRLAAGAPLAIRYTKLAVNKLIRTALNDAFDVATALEVVTFASADHQEALAAMRERREPRFEGR